VFTRFQGERPLALPIGRHTAWRIVTRYSRLCGIVPASPHALRRFVGTQIARRDIRQAQKALGHARIETTARHYVLDDLQGGLTDHLY
jgi:integrase